MRRLRIFIIAPVVVLCATSPVVVRASTPAPSAAPSAVAMPSPVASGNAGLAQFTTESLAQVHCPSDKVVWLNLRNGVYFEKDSLYWGKTKRGAYVCRKEADAAGDHESTFVPLNPHEY